MSSASVQRVILATALITATVGIWAGTLPGNQASVEDNQPKYFRMIVLPDTQHYVDRNNRIFEQQTDWIIRHQTQLNIAFVGQLGDIVERPADEREWRKASAAMSALDGKIAYGLAPGNHDIIRGVGSPLFTREFPLERITASALPIVEVAPSLMSMPHLGVIDATNTYHLISAGGQDYIIFNLEFCPTDQVVQATKQLLHSHIKRQAIIFTHSFINATGQRETYLGSCAAYAAMGTNSANRLWNKLIQSSPNNVRLIMSGHDIHSPVGAARRTDMVQGRPVHQLLSNYQEFPDGGQGYLRILTFDLSSNTLDVQTYSPWLNSYLTDPQNQFRLNL